MDFLNNNWHEKAQNRRYKENYIANMLLRTLYSNDVSDAECYHIIKKFKDMVLGSDVIVE